MRGDHRIAVHDALHPEDLAEAATRAEDELDLALVEAQQLDRAGRPISGGAGSVAASASSIGPAGDDGAVPISPSLGWVAVVTRRD